ncbi:MAG TPA: single-stranded-DNA-specific exonuclease RecJ [Steroidobacteraceae bacterium]|nr:single-stranded-DNA-specific exonuclease RecJ [Steroidobacteraceae bacterium]
MIREIRRRVVPDVVLDAKLHPLLRRVYAARGVASDAELKLSLDQLIPVGQLDGVTQAVELLIAHRARGSRILVVGDFDADGATSTALVVRQLRRLGFADVQYMVPNRFQFGYGLTPEIVQLAAKRAPNLIITVDNGVSSIAGVAAARAAGIDTLVTDHHLPGKELPAATAMVNPNLQTNAFASKALAGVGVAFYTMAALTRELVTRGECNADATSIAELLDLVAAGTVADLVPLDFNNRILVHQGLRRIRSDRCVAGVRAILEVAGKRIDKVVAADLAFQVGPRLNAAGRLDDMSIGIECLLTDDLDRARALAAELAQLNHERRDLEQRMQQEALAIVADMHEDQTKLPLGVCLYEESWHQGVVGLVASRVKDRVHRPVIAMARADHATLKGSARSVPGVHIRDVLDAIAARHPTLVDKFGGHAMAAGLTIAANRFDEFSTAFNEEVSHWMTVDDAQGVVQSDGEVSRDDFTLEAARELRAGGPWGQHFPEPVFDGRFTVVETRTLGERHLKLKVRTEAGTTCDAIAFRYFDADDAEPVANTQQVELAYRLDVNEYNGTERLQLVVEHLRKL